MRRGEGRAWRGVVIIMRSSELCILVSPSSPKLSRQLAEELWPNSNYATSRVEAPAEGKTGEGRPEWKDYP